MHEEAEFVSVGAGKDLSELSADAFWIFLDPYSWVHCYDADGSRRPLNEVPRRFEDMVDDPYRSLAGDIRDAGGFSKADTPFLQFL